MISKLNDLMVADGRVAEVVDVGVAPAAAPPAAAAPDTLDEGMAELVHLKLAARNAVNNVTQEQFDLYQKDLVKVIACQDRIISDWNAYVGGVIDSIHRTQ